MKTSVKLMMMALNTVNVKKAGKEKIVLLQLVKISTTVASMVIVLQVKMVHNKSASVKMAGLEQIAKKSVLVVTMELAEMVNVPVTTVL